MHGTFTIKRFLATTLLATVAATSLGCDILDRAADRLTGPMKEFIEEVKKARNESEEWRKLVQEMERSFRQFPADGGVEARAFVDFLIERAKENSAELAEITGLLKKKEYIAALKAYRKFERSVSLSNPPKTALINPKSLTLTWKTSHAYLVEGGFSSIVLTGWNFQQPVDSDVPSSQRKQWKVELRNLSDDNTIVIANQSLTITNNYIAQVSLDGPNGLRLRPNQGRLVLKCGNFRRWDVVAEIPIIFSNSRPMREEITDLEDIYNTRDEDKDNDDGHVGNTIYFRSRLIADGPTESAGDPGTVWRDESIHGPYRIHLKEAVPWSEVGSMSMAVWHQRNGGDPAWRFRFKTHAVVTVTKFNDLDQIVEQREELRLVRDEFDDHEQMNHKPGDRTWWSFDLRGGRGSKLSTPVLPLRAR